LTAIRRKAYYAAVAGAKLRGIVGQLRHLTRRAAGLAIAAATFTAVTGCDQPAPSPAVHPDTGIGAGETAPATIDCLDLCLRGAECVGDLCNEDKMSSAYTALAQELALQCSATCATNPPNLGSITQAQWQCLFQSSCRQVFEHDVCNVNARYSCS